MSAKIAQLLFFLALVLTSLVTSGQGFPDKMVKPIYPHSDRVNDSIAAMQVPLLPIPEPYRSRALPAVVDNTLHPCWPDIYHQGSYFSCQQYAGVVYTFAYEINRLRGLSASLPENRFPAHYTWSFMNNGEQYEGVNFLQSFEVIRQQGHMNYPDFGWDTISKTLRWANGYEKYYHGMRNRIRQVYAIEINCDAGINAMKQYLYDHLDGSPVGGIACFTTDSWSLNTMSQLPPGTPEEGKQVVVAWKDSPVHGLAIVGYNDSIRFDLNSDGLFTNNVDINGDGAVNSKDWEIGGFKLANSYGDTWADSGFCYVLYSAMASNYEEGGVWNNRVYVVEADTAYAPLLTMKTRITYSQRARIRLFAGINPDTLADIPLKTVDFPIFNFQGGDHAMTGLPDTSVDNSLEAGLDITPLLDHLPAGKPVRLFLGVEERDPTFNGTGTIHQTSFISHAEETQTFTASQEEVNIAKNQITYVSTVVILPAPDKVKITTEELPACTPSAPYSVQLTAAGGITPYRWHLSGSHLKQMHPAAFRTGEEVKLYPQSENAPFAAVKLPFTFPFYGKGYDTIYVNNFGFISFEPQSLPAPYVTDEAGMLMNSPVICPAFSQLYSLQGASYKGMFLITDSASVQIRWKLPVREVENESEENFALILSADGIFEFLYGSFDDNTILPCIYTGMAKGDGLAGEITSYLQLSGLADQGFSFLPPQIPVGTTLTPEGLLLITEADASQLHNIEVTVTDGHSLSDTKCFRLSADLDIEAKVRPDSSGHIRYGLASSFDLVLKNRGTTPIPAAQLKLSSSDTSCIVTNGVHMAGTIQPGESIEISDIFSFTLKHPLDDGYPLRLQLQVESEMRSWQTLVDVTVAAPEIVVSTPAIADGDNHILDAGEVADLLIQIGNEGSLPGEEIEVILESMDPAVTILSSDVQSIGDCDPFTIHVLKFQLMRQRSAPPGISSAMKLTVQGKFSVNEEMEFTLAGEKKAIAIVSPGSSNTSANAMCAILDSLELSYDTIGHMNFEYSNYHTLFLILGHSTQGYYVISDEVGTALAQYLSLNGNIYMEGYFPWYYQPTTPLHQMFRYETERCTRYYFPELDGVYGTFTAPMSFHYNNALVSAPFSITPVAPAFSIFENRDDPPRCLEFAYDGSDYKTIGSMLEFSSRVDSIPPSTRAELMQRYLDFFQVNCTGLYPLFHVAKGDVCSGNSVVFYDDSYDGITAWSWEFPGGNPSVSELQNPGVRYDTPGMYDVTLTVSDGVKSRTLKREHYISVSNCTTLSSAESRPGLFIHPNPATNTIRISGGSPPEGVVTIQVRDLTGRTVLSQHSTLDAKGVAHMNISALHRGLYIISMTVEGRILTGKLLVR